jgi:hypothetical protein
MRPLALAFLLAVPLVAQANQGTAVDYTFPAFTNGDGRQKLSDFLGQPVLVATFANGWGGQAASQVALDLHEQHAADGLVVVLSYQGTIDKAAPIEAPAWAMRLHPGANVRVCASLGNTPWTWSELPHYWAVIGPDGELLGAGNVQTNTKAMVEAAKAALQRSTKGWGDAAEAAVRACYARGALAKARAKADACNLAGEVDALFERECAAVRWLIADGQWQRAKAEAARVASGAKGVPAWDVALATLQGELASDDAKRELDLDAKLERLLAPIATKRPDDALGKRLREFAKKNDGSRVAVRATRLAELADQSVRIR